MLDDRLGFRCRLTAKADVLHSACVSRSDGLYAFRETIALELFALRPPHRISRRTLHIRIRLECSYRWDRYVAVQNGQKNHSVHSILSQACFFFTLRVRGNERNTGIPVPSAKD